MHVLLCTKRDLVANVMLQRLLPSLSGMQVSVVLANRRRGAALAVPALRTLRLFEEDLPNEILFPLARGAGAPGTLVPFETLSERGAVTLIDAQGLRRDERSALYRSLAPDLILTFKYGFLLTDGDISLPRFGAYNLHSGRLPERPGLHAIFWAMRDGDGRTTATVHQIDTNIDTGPIVLARDRYIEPNRSFFHTMVETYLLGADLLGEVATTIARTGGISSTHQVTHPDRRYLTLPTGADIAAFEAAGGVMVDAQDYLALTQQYVPPGSGDSPAR